jgi:hypothetical protein
MTVYFLDVRLALVFVRCGVFFGFNLLSNFGLGLPNRVTIASFIAWLLASVEGDGVHFGSRNHVI